VLLLTVPLCMSLMLQSRGHGAGQEGKQAQAKASLVAGQRTPLPWWSWWQRRERPPVRRHSLQDLINLRLKVHVQEPVSLVQDLHFPHANVSS